MKLRLSVAIMAVACFSVNVRSDAVLAITELNESLTVTFNGSGPFGTITPLGPESWDVELPAGYAFSIWSLIYLSVTAFAIYQLLPANLARFRNVRSMFIVTCVLNCAWIYFWHHQQMAICLVLIIALLASLLFLLVLFGRSE